MIHVERFRTRVAASRCGHVVIILGAVSHLLLGCGRVGFEAPQADAPKDIGSPVDTDPVEDTVDQPLDTILSDTEPTDTGPTDSGLVDTGPTDSGLVDTGPTDSGVIDTAEPSKDTQTEDAVCVCPEIEAPCTTHVCVAGACVVVDVPDGHACNFGECGLGTCEAGACVVGPDLHLCDDGNPCTADGCTDGTCMHKDDPDCGCEDASLCPVADFPACVKKVCFPGAECVLLPVDGETCEDGDPCTEGDYCLNQVCAGDPKCVDDSPCKEVTCSDGVCDFTPIDCDDDNPCTLDICNEGACLHSPDDSCSCTSDADCLDGVNPGFSCSESVCIAGQCYQALKSKGTPCFGPCAQPGECMDGGMCSAYKGCQDDDICTINICVDGNVCETQPKCDDGLACTVDECKKWDGGQCVSHDKCDDVEPCTLSFCTKGGCHHVDTGCTLCTKTSDCDDFKQCTKESCGQNQVCESSNLPVGEPCLGDNLGNGFCNGTGGCVD